MNARLAQVAHGVAEAELQQARGQFYSECAAGVHDEQAEQQFADALRAKEFYYATFYTSYDSQANQKLLRLDSIIGNGNRIDGGIPPGTELAFTVFAHAYAALMLNPPADDQDGRDRSENVSALYYRYVFFRNEYERKHWAETRTELAGPAADTPEKIADMFVKMLGRAADEKYAGQPDQLASFKPWLEQIHAGIITFETAVPTAEVVAQQMREAHYPPDIVQTFLDRVNAASSNGTTNQYVLEHEDVNAVNELDRRGGHKGNWEPNWTYLRTNLKSLASGGAGRQINELIKHPPQPLLFQTYNSARSDIINGTWMFPAKPPAPGTDWCTGKPLSEAATADAGSSSP